MQGLNDVSAAGAQMLVHALPEGVVDTVNKATEYVNHAPYLGAATQMLGMVPASPASLDADIASNERQYQASRQAGMDWPRMLGNALGTAPAAVVGGPAAGIGKIATLGAAQGLVGQPVIDTSKNDFWSQKTQQAAIGAGTNLAAIGVLKGIAAALSPQVRPAVQTLLDAGVTPTPGQILGGGANRIEQAATSIPVVGDTIKNAQRRAVQQLNTAAINRSLTPIGEQLPAGVTGRDAIEHAVGKLSGAYDDIVTKIGAVQPDNKFLTDLSSLQGLATGLPKEQSDQFGRILDHEILARFKGANGVITGEDLKAAESNLGTLARGYGRSGDFDKMRLGTAIQEAQSTLRQLIERQAPAHADKLASINTGYANLMRVQRAASSLAADKGTFTAAQLQNAVKALDPSKNKRQFATGNALMQDLSDAGKSVLGPTLPDSGTPFRHAVQAGVAGAVGHGMLPEWASGAVVPAAVGLGALSLPYTVYGQKAASSLLAGERPEALKQIAAALRGVAPFAPLVAQPLSNGSQK